MIRRFARNLQVTLAGGYLLFFFSERLFWTVFKPGDGMVDLAITWLAYSVLGCVLLNVLKRCDCRALPRVAVAGAIYGWLAEGALVGTLYGTESSAPFPLSIVQTALSWHMLLSVVVGFHFLTSAVRSGNVPKTALIAGGIGLFWAAWAPFQWRETPPVMVSVWSFFVHAMVSGTLLALACGMLSGGAMREYKPGRFGLILSLLVLGIFYSEQVKALGIRALVVLPILVGGVLALLQWTKDESDPRLNDTLHPTRWLCALCILAMPVAASLGYAIQAGLHVRGMNPSWVFHGLALAGGVGFLLACVLVVRGRAGVAEAQQSAG